MGRKPLSGTAKNKSAPLRVLLTDEERERLNRAAALSGESATSTWARGLLFGVAEQIESIVPYCEERGVDVGEFVRAAIERQLSCKRM